VSSNTVTDGDAAAVANYGVCGNTASSSVAESLFLGNLATSGEGGAIYNSTARD
jgi:predicted outer membrane repeat protein